MALSIGQILHLYELRGARRRDGEAIGQLEHALQCAQLAREAGACAALVAAAFLHDFGHLLTELPEGGCRGMADAHEHLAIPFLQGTFPRAVTEPIRLHVEAKRFLCHAVPGYAQALTAASCRSLARQGGAFDAVQAERFLRRPWSVDAIRLRRWDDQAKVPGAGALTLADMAWILPQAALPAAAEPVPV